MLDSLGRLEVSLHARLGLEVSLNARLGLDVLVSDIDESNKDQDPGGI